MSPMDFASGKNYPSESDWDRYLETHYHAGTKFLKRDDDFLSYVEDDNEVYINDCIAEDPINAICLWSQINEVAGERPIRFKVHTANYKLLQTAIKLGFEIIGFDSVQYELRRK